MSRGSRFQRIPLFLQPLNVLKTSMHENFYKTSTGVGKQIESASSIYIKKNSTEKIKEVSIIFFILQPVSNIVYDPPKRTYSYFQLMKGFVPLASFRMEPWLGVGRKQSVLSVRRKFHFIFEDFKGNQKKKKRHFRPMCSYILNLLVNFPNQRSKITIRHLRIHQ